jgi:FKBP-type peptidyl-prolyl cis-trans isomerase FkpA
MMMRRSMYVLMICAAAASMAQAVSQTPAQTGATPPPVDAAVPAVPPVPPTPVDPAQPTPAPETVPVAPVAPVVPVAPVAPVAPVVPSIPPEPVLDPLVKTDTVIGKGALAVPGSKVFVHYTGWLYKPMAPRQRGREFDSSIKRGEPLEFVLGTGRVIKGWDQGIKGMKVGGKRTLIIPSHLAYGSRGAGTMIAPGADLIFDVHLVDVK